MIHCHRCKKALSGYTATVDGQWTCEACLYELETGRPPKPSPKPPKAKQVGMGR